jgi:aryl-alcohol dehydrogenase-like predicted oxidoreductase
VTEQAPQVATQALAQRHGATARPWAYRALGRTGLVVSALGVGGYRVDDDREEHARALRKAVREGVNLVDTSTNYTDGGSERAIGHALIDLAKDGIPREEIVVVSKVGYVQGSNLEVARSREREDRPFDDMVRYAEGCWHCIHPDFIADQLGRSLSRLGLARLDVELLHNPEYMLMEAEHRGGVTLQRRREEFDRRIRLAFARLEEEADAGRISWYGVSSNSFVAPKDAPEATSLARMLDLAEEVARERGKPSHRFAVAQLPMNLLERGGVLEKNGPRDVTVLEVARRAGIGVLVNRPLNAFSGGRLVRLADFPDPEGAQPIAAAAHAVTALEDEFATTIAPSFDKSDASSLFAWGNELLANADRFDDILHWRQVEADYIRPRVDHVTRHVSLHLVGKVRNDWADWLARYQPALETLLRAIEAEALPAARERSSSIHRQVERLMPQAWRGRSLSQMALGLLLGTPGVTCVLVGMRREAWVEDALRSLELAPPEAGAATWAAITAGLG